MKRMAKWNVTDWKPGELTPEICMARWHYGCISSRDQARPPARLRNSLVAERTTSRELGILLATPMFLFIFGTFLLLGIYFLVSLQHVFFGISLIFFAAFPVVIFIGVSIGSASILYYNSKFTPPYLTFNCASLIPGSAVTVHYRHSLKNARRTVHGFVLMELVAATHTHLPGTLPEGPATDTHYQILWSSGVQIHAIAPNIAGMTFEQVLNLPEGLPDAGPLPLEGKELEKEAVWYARVCEVTLPRASCEYAFILPVGGAQHEPPGPSQESQSLHSINTGQDLCVA